MVRSKVTPTGSILNRLGIAACTAGGIALSFGPAGAQAPNPPAQAIPHQQSQITAQPAVSQPVVSQPVLSQGWTAADIQVEQARCNQLLKALDIVAKPANPVREHECGAAAPIELISVGKSPQVTFYPPVTVTCDLAVALHRWVTKDLQALSRKHLGAPIIRVDTMSSYSCRTAYGRKNARLSEHGRANAVDIRSFTTSNGSTSDILADWGPTGTEIAAQVAAAKRLDADRAVAAANTAKSGSPSRTPAQPGALATAPASNGIATGSIPPTASGLADLTRPTISLGSRGSTGNPLGIPMPSTSDTGLGISNGSGLPSRLGGPKGSDAEAIVLSGKTDFLRGAHATACQIFGTVLGPEANAAHRNHFHVDMAERKLRSICE
jgi:hypothetical protein